MFFSRFSAFFGFFPQFFNKKQGVPTHILHKNQRYPIQNLSSFPTKKLTCESDIQFWPQWPKYRRGVKLTPPARFWTFFSLPGIGLKKQSLLEYMANMAITTNFTQMGQQTQRQVDVPLLPSMKVWKEKHNRQYEFQIWYHQLRQSWQLYTSPSYIFRTKTLHPTVALLFITTHKSPYSHY